jgi:hypothetical protein
MPIQQMEEELRLLKLEKRIADLELTVRRYNTALTESSNMLAQCEPKPRRPAIPHEVKLKLCARQNWSCNDPYGTCPLWEIGDGRFTEEFLPFHCDHITPYASHPSNAVEGLQILCTVCHNKKSREERISLLASQRAQPAKN